MHKKYLTTAAILAIAVGSCFMTADAKADDNGWTVLGDALNDATNFAEMPMKMAGMAMQVTGNVVDTLATVGGDIAIAGINATSKVVTGLGQDATSIAQSAFQSPVGAVAGMAAEF